MTISAIEARSAASQVNAARYNEEHTKTFYAIELATKAGQYKTETKKLSTAIRTELDDLGYTIEDYHNGQDRVTYSKISW